MNFWKEINELPKEDLIDLLYEYDKYLEQARDEDWFRQGWVPVCIAEFYETELPMLLEERSTRDQTNEEGEPPAYSSCPESLPE